MSRPKTRAPAPAPPPPTPVTRPASSVSRLKSLADQYREMQARLEQGGGADKIRRQHEQGKLTARERVAALLDTGGEWLEVGLLVAYDRSEEHTSDLQSQFPL